MTKIRLERLNLFAVVVFLVLLVFPFQSLLMTFFLVSWYTECGLDDKLRTEGDTHILHKLAIGCGSIQTLTWLDHP